ncbi:MAG: MBL fold metallo-hydrolase [Candidatus Azotimanducaceae bacterium WSBS_2022_MAG_OTU7]
MRPEEIDPADLEDQKIGPVTILFGFKNGKYPYGNSLVVAGSKQTAIIDPCLGVVARKEVLPSVDMVIHSHAHEDHIAGTHLFRGVPWHAHTLDALGLESIQGLMEIYGTPPGPGYDAFKKEIETAFYYPAGGEVQPFDEGHVFDLGDVTVSVLHTPGHTRGHCCFLIEWGEAVTEKLVYLGDIELTGFGPYYGDAWSNLIDFEKSIERLKQVDAGWWLTFHHKGLVEGRATFLVMLDQFEAMIQDREKRLLEFIEQPRTMAEIVEHRFVYRPGQTGLIIDETERRSMALHLDRLIDKGHVNFSGGTYHTRRYPK